MKDLCSVNLVKPLLCFPKLPSLHSFRLVSARGNICVIFGRRKWSCCSMLFMPWKVRARHQSLLHSVASLLVTLVGEGPQLGQQPLPLLSQVCAYLHDSGHQLLQQAIHMLNLEATRDQHSFSPCAGFSMSSLFPFHFMCTFPSCLSVGHFQVPAPEAKTTV